MDFIFIHINKTAGSSIEIALGVPFEHKTALQKIAEVGHEKWDQSFTFTVVRNPWDKVCSHYHYRVKTNRTNLGINKIPFTDWVQLSYGNRDPFYFNKPLMFAPQLEWITGQNGKILVDFICRFERLKEDFGYVCKQLGKQVALPHLNGSARGPYRQYYDDATAEIVARRFSKDIEFFGYEF